MKIKIAALCVCFFAGVAHGQVGASFGQGRTRFSVNGGYSSFNDKTYGVIGAGAGYYLLDGLEVGVDGDAWVGDKPHIYTVSPGVRYVITSLETIKPYVGGFYKRTFYDDFPSINSIGGRAGIVSSVGAHAYLSAGLVFEKMYDCNKTLYDSCDQVYPELGISFAY